MNPKAPAMRLDRIQRYGVLFCWLLLAVGVASGQQFPGLQSVQVEDLNTVPRRTIPPTMTIFAAQQENEMALPDDEDADEESDSDEEDEDEEKEREREKRLEAELRRKATARHLGRLLKPVTQVRLGLSPGAGSPENQAALTVPTQTQTIYGGSDSRQRLHPHAGCMVHRPLYFENKNLERCGNGHGCLQNGASALLFLSQALTLPYQLTTKRADQLVQSPGGCLSCQSFPSEFESLTRHGLDRHGIVSQAAAIAGFTFLAL